MLTKLATLSLLALSLACAKPDAPEAPATPPDAPAPVSAPSAFSTTEAPSAVASSELTVFKDPNCGCCAKWIAYMQGHGYKVTAQDTKDMPAVKQSSGIPAQAQSCHTGKIGGYVIEGHVPVEDVNRLLRERPDIKGIAVAGMPTGSPGMEGYPTQSYDVLALNKDGTTSVFAKH